MNSVGNNFKFHGSLLLRIFLLLAVCFPAHAIERSILIPEGQGGLYVKWHAAPAIRVGNQVWVSGYTAYVRPGQSYEEMVKGVYGKIGESLAMAGASLDDIVEVVSYTTDKFENFEAFQRAHAEVFATPPTWTAVGVETLVDARLSLEIKVVAVIGSSDKVQEKWSDLESYDSDYSKFPGPGDIYSLHDHILKTTDTKTIQ